VTPSQPGRAVRPMTGFSRAAPCVLGLCLSASWVAARTQPPTRTVCTITVNSPDEKETFRRHLPAATYTFVELVERGRPDWLASACQSGVQCDMLIISGHYDGGNVFFSDQLEKSEFLPVDELERISCSDSCPGLFSQLKEVHLFGCNTLNPQAHSSASAEVVRSLVREGHSLKEAERQLLALNAEHGESGRDRMRQLFKDVPVIYGFSSVAPLGPVAASTLGGYFRSAGAQELGQGRVSTRLLGHFSQFGMTVTKGMTDKDPHVAVRDDVCRFVNDRSSDANKLGFVHQLLRRGAGQARVHLDRIQRLATLLEAPTRRTPAVTQALAEIADDGATRERFLDFARDADQPAVRARMLKLAHDLGWLTPTQRWEELELMLVELQARRTVDVNEVDLACYLNQEHHLDGAFDRLYMPSSRTDEVARAAVLACLGSDDAHARTLQALVSPTEADVKIAQAYLRHRPLSNATELLQLAERIARMPASAAQVRALESLGRHYVSDRDILERLTRLFSATPSSPVQTAIAGILLRADLRSIANPQLVATLQKDRRTSPPGGDVVDALLRRLQSN
jgi:hypothetical protein